MVHGIMVMVSMWELFPEAKKHSVGDLSCFWMGTISEVVVIARFSIYNNKIKAKIDVYNRALRSEIEGKYNQVTGVSSKILTRQRAKIIE